MQDFERLFKFYFLLLMHIPSFLCSLYVLYHFKWKRLIDQTFGLLLIVNTLLIVLELPFTLIYLHEGSVSSGSLCVPWILINYTFFVLGTILPAWASVERYFFIFHEQFILRHRFLLHYIPIALILLYVPLFYIAFVVIYPCQQEIRLEEYICGAPCFIYDLGPCLIDWVLNVIFVLLINSAMNVLLVVSNLHQRQRMRKSIITPKKTQQWRRTVKLSIQVFSISVICMIAWLPFCIVSTVQMFYETPLMSYVVSNILSYSPYIESLFLPYASLLFLPEVKQRCSLSLNRLRRRTVVSNNNRIHVANLPLQ